MASPFLAKSERNWDEDLHNRMSRATYEINDVQPFLSHYQYNQSLSADLTKKFSVISNGE